ncbi:MAG: hypothetical protein IT385_23220 [Deltaproteobacteria bacterium]|nr:hypothetical protein [Deltaproteobacteria bacterium]
MLAAYLIALIVGGVFVGLSVMAGLGKDLEADHGEPGHVHVGADDGSLAEAAHAGAPDKRRLWLPFTSFRFWTFGAFFFGLTGLLLHEVALVPEPTAMLAALGTGVVGGTASAAIVRALRRPVGGVKDPSRWVGTTAELLLPLAPGGLSKVRVRAGEKDRELIVTLADPRGRSLPKGSRVIVLELGADGRARVAPESAIFANTQDAPRGEEVES